MRSCVANKQTDRKVRQRDGWIDRHMVVMALKPYRRVFLQLIKAPIDLMFQHFCGHRSSNSLILHSSNQRGD